MARRAPLEGIRVADFTWVWAGPFCTLQLAHLGAEVIRVETSTRICVTRMLPPFADFQMGPNRSGYFNQYNQGKRSVALDLKRPEAIEVAKRLCANSDLVVENFAAGVMDRMGLGYDVLRGLRPDVIMIALSGYGATGPDHDKVSYGPAQVPLSGMSSVTGYAGFPPMHVGISYGDPTGGLHGAVAVLAALLHRARTGQGQYIDLAQGEASLHFLAPAILDYGVNGRIAGRIGNRDRDHAPHGVYPAAGDDRWIAIAVTSDVEWQALARAMARPDLAADARFRDAAGRLAHADELDGIVAAWTAPEDAHVLEMRLQAAQVPAHVVQTSRDLRHDPQLHHRGHFVTVAHPMGGATVVEGSRFRLSRTPAAVASTAPSYGQHNDAVLRDVLGYDDDAITALVASGALE